MNIALQHKIHVQLFRDEDENNTVCNEARKSEGHHIKVECKQYSILLYMSNYSCPMTYYLESSFHTV